MKESELVEGGHRGWPDGRRITTKGVGVGIEVKRGNDLWRPDQIAIAEWFADIGASYVLTRFEIIDLPNNLVEDVPRGYVPTIDVTSGCASTIEMDLLGEGHPVRLARQDPDLSYRACVENAEWGPKSWTIKTHALPDRWDPTGSVLRFADIELDPRRCVATRGGNELVLRLRGLEVLRYLLEHGRATYKELFQSVWKSDIDPLNSNTLAGTMNEIRTALEKYGDRVVHSGIRGTSSYMLSERPCGPHCGCQQPKPNKATSRVSS